MAVAASTLWPSRVSQRHLLPAADHGGPTDQDNASPCCGHHNRLKTHGYNVTRLHDDTLAIHHPDSKRIN